ncbi:MAG: glycosyltransferase, partial [Streptococcus sp.]|nr:glycosyltransferase [Streptococcus sp.]
MTKMAPMRIGFIVNNYPPHMGGVEQHVHSLALELAKLGHQISVITLADKRVIQSSSSNKKSLYKNSKEESAVKVLRTPRWFNVGDVFSLPTPLG